MDLLFTIGKLLTIICVVQYLKIHYVRYVGLSGIYQQKWNIPLLSMFLPVILLIIVFSEA